MRTLISVLLTAVLAGGSVLASSRSSSSSRSRSSTSSRTATSKRSSTHKSTAATHAPAIKCVGCARDSSGHIARSEKAKNDFKKSHPCPSTGRSSVPCPGYAVDHRTPLYKGGADTPDNMQWLSNGQHAAKHKKLK